jgi:hypothetical protein
MPETEVDLLIKSNMSSSTPHDQDFQSKTAQEERERRINTLFFKNDMDLIDPEVPQNLVN